VELNSTGQTKRSESELDNTVWTTYSVQEDSAGLDMWYKWITSHTSTGVALGGSGV